MQKDEDGFLSIDNEEDAGGKGAGKVMAFAKVGTAGGKATCQGQGQGQGRSWPWPRWVGSDKWMLTQGQDRGRGQGQIRKGQEQRCGLPSSMS